MKKHFRALTAALLSLILFSSVPATASVAVTEASELTDTAPQTEFVMGAAPSAEKVGTLPTLGYEEMIYSLEDYILALKRTYINNDELKQALAAAERNDSYVDNSKLKQKLNYKGETGFCDGAMLTDLNTIIPDINSDIFNDYTWSVRFVDRGVDKTALTVKEAMIVDENNGKTYELDTQFPFQLNGSDKTVFFKNYYHFSKLYVPDASTLVVDNELKFTFKTANETYGTTPIKYAIVIAKDGKQVFSKLQILECMI